MRACADGLSAQKPIQDQVSVFNSRSWSSAAKEGSTAQLPRCSHAKQVETGTVLPRCSHAQWVETGSVPSRCSRAMIQWWEPRCSGRKMLLLGQIVSSLRRHTKETETDRSRMCRSWLRRNHRIYEAQDQLSMNLACRQRADHGGHRFENDRLLG
jgi:hypothetical protein